MYRPQLSLDFWEETMLILLRLLGGAVGVGFCVSCSAFQSSLNHRIVASLWKVEDILSNWHFLFLFQDKQWPGLLETDWLRCVWSTPVESSKQYELVCDWYPIIALQLASFLKPQGYCELRDSSSLNSMPLWQSQQPLSFLRGSDVIAFKWVVSAGRPCFQNQEPFMNPFIHLLHRKPHKN